MPKKGKPVRPLISKGISGNLFRPVVPARRTIRLPAHPMVVANDLKKGCLDSLREYLAQNEGIHDPEVALELLKLLVGSAKNTKFRLVLVDHPDAHVDKGGRPPSKTLAPTPQELEIVEEYRAQFDFFGKIKVAREETAKVFSVSVTTVKRAQQKVEAAEARHRYGEQLRNRREAALDKLRRES